MRSRSFYFAFILPAQRNKEIIVLRLLILPSRTVLTLDYFQYHARFTYNYLEFVMDVASNQIIL